jgi:hypothetical protein
MVSHSSEGATDVMKAEAKENGHSISLPGSRARGLNFRRGNIEAILSKHLTPFSWLKHLSAFFLLSLLDLCHFISFLTIFFYL